MAPREGRPMILLKSQYRRIEQLAYTADGMTAAAGSDSGNVVVWDLE